MPELAGVIAAELARTGVDPSGLVLAMTENAAIVNVERAQRFADEVNALGCGFALDDFGAGFASFYFLKHLDFHYLKIDGEFIHNLPRTRPTSCWCARWWTSRAAWASAPSPSSWATTRPSSCCAGSAPTTRRASTWAARDRST